MVHGKLNAQVQSKDLIEASHRALASPPGAGPSRQEVTIGAFWTLDPGSREGGCVTSRDVVPPNAWTRIGSENLSRDENGCLCVEHAMHKLR
eukprot:3416528-Rhodomonas_salina.2